MIFQYFFFYHCYHCVYHYAIVCVSLHHNHFYITKARTSKIDFSQFHPLTN